MKSLIYGYGETGKSFERYLQKKNLEFKIFDKNIIEYNKDYNLTDFDQILCSPGIPRNDFEEIIKLNKKPTKKSTFLFGISHELPEIIGIIIGLYLNQKC